MRSMVNDAARVTVTVRADVATALRIFTEEIDQWWRRGVRFRSSGARRDVIRIEPGVGGRRLKSIDGEHGEIIVEIGHTPVWDAPTRFVFSRRAQNFALARPGCRAASEPTLFSRSTP
jgi:hypothetical protein